MSEVDIYNPDMFATFEIEMKEAVYDYHYMPSPENHNRITDAIYGMVYATSHRETIFEPALEAFENWLYQLDQFGYEDVILYNFEKFCEYAEYQ